MSKQKLLLWVPLVLVVLVAAVAGYVALAYEARASHVWEVPAANLSASTDPAVIEHGRHLAETRGCADCHTKDYGGQTMADDGFMGYLASANLTGGRGGILGQTTDAQLERALRHGVGADGRSLILMPAVDYWPLNDDDIVALISYLRSLPPVDREHQPPRVGPGARALIVLKAAPLLVAETVDHDAVRESKPAVAVSAEYGQYVAAVCLSCHGRNYAGGIVNGPPGTPASANLTPAGDVDSWSEEQFVHTLQTCARPDGRKLNDKAMPCAAFAGMNDVEKRSIYAFLRTLPPAAGKLQ